MWFWARLVLKSFTRSTRLLIVPSREFTLVSSGFYQDTRIDRFTQIGYGLEITRETVSQRVERSEPFKSREPCVERAGRQVLRNHAWCGYSHTGLERLLTLPQPLFAFAARFCLGLAFDAQGPAATDLACGKPSRASQAIDELVQVVARADGECPALKALQAALVRARVKGTATVRADALYADAGKPGAVAREAAAFLVKIALALAALFALFFLLELLLLAMPASREGIQAFT